MCVSVLFLLRSQSTNYSKQFSTRKLGAWCQQSCLHCTVLPCTRKHRGAHMGVCRTEGRTHLDGCRCQRYSAARTGSKARTARSALAPSKTCRRANAACSCAAALREATGTSETGQATRHVVGRHPMWCMPAAGARGAPAHTSKHNPCRLERRLHYAYLKVGAHEAEQVMKVRHRQLSFPQNLQSSTQRVSTLLGR